MAGEVFTLFARLGIKDDEFNKGIKNASSKGKSLASGLKGAFKVGTAAIVGTAAAVAGLSKAFIGAAKDTADYGDRVDKMSQKIGISAEAYQKWDYVMQRAGGNVDSLKMGMKTLSQQAEKNSDSFQKLGISQEEVATLSKEDLFTKTIQGLSQMEEGTERTALATQLLGRAGADMGPLLNQGSEAIEEQMKIAEKYGMVMSDEAVRASAAWEDSITTLSMTTQGLKNRLMGEFLPSLTEVTDGLALVFAGDYSQGVDKISSGIENLTQRINEMLPKVLEIGGEIVMNLATSIVTNLPKLLDTALSVIMKLGEALINQAPLLLSSGLQIILSLAKSLTAALPTLLPTVVSIVLEIVNMLTDPSTLSGLLDAALQLVLALANGLIAALPQLVAALPQIITNIVTFLVNSIPQIIQAGIQLFMALVGALPEIITGIVNAIPQIIEGVITAVLGAIPQLIEAGIQLFVSLIEALPQIIEAIVQAVPLIINGLVSAFKNLFPRMVSIGLSLLKQVFNGIRKALSGIGEVISSVWASLKNGFSSIIDGAIQWGRDLIDNFVGGIMNMWNKLKSKVTGIADFFKNILGHSTPKEGPMAHDDRWMPDFMDNLIDGIDKKMPELQMAVNGIAGTMASDYSIDDYGYTTEGEDVQRFEFSFAEGNAPLLQIARLLFPYMQVVEKERGAY